MKDDAPRLRKLKVEGFRSLRDVEVTFPDGPTVLVGANGAGKSNLLEIFRMVAFLRSGSLRRFVGESGGASAILHYGPQVTREIVFELEFERHNQNGILVRNGYRARLGYAAGDTLVFLDEEVGYGPSINSDLDWNSLGAGHAESRISDTEDLDTTARVVLWLLRGLNFYHFHDTSPTSPLRQNARAEDDRFLHSYGLNLAAYLLAIKQSEDHSAWHRIHALIRQICPFIKTLCPTPVLPARPATEAEVNSAVLPFKHVRLEWIDERDQRFGVHQLSDGSLRAIALITTLAQPVRQLPFFPSIDEPELGLHPAAVALVCELVESVAPHAQVLLATQSPALLDHLPVESVVVTDRDEGGTVLRRLKQEALRTWLDDYSVSELFDKNVLGGRP